MSAGSTTARRHDLDWLRVGALGLLIVTHATYVYRTTGWRLHSEHAGVWADMLVEALAPWRMSLVFFIGGAATRFMLEGRDPGAFVINRVMRLGVPFLAGVFLLVPPMWYLTDPLARGHGYLEYAWRTPLHAHTVFGLHLPDLGHVWFLPYLLSYAMLAALAWRFAPAAWRRVQAVLEAMPVAGLLAGVAAVFVLSDAGLRPIFGRTDMLVDDPAGHVRAMPAFLVGLMLARSTRFWDQLKAARSWLLPLALALMAAALATAAGETLSGHSQAAWITGVADGAYGAAAVFAILATAQTMLNHDSPLLRYLSDAIMPVYLMHEPMIVAAGLAVMGAGLPVWLEYPAILGVASLIPLAIYHVAIRGFGPLRILFGLKPDHGAPARSSPHEAAG